MRLPQRSSLALLPVLVLAAWLRFSRLATTPGWYSDEGTHLDIAKHLLEGRVQYQAISSSTLLFAKLPVFDWLVAGWAMVRGLDILAVRQVSALCGVVAVLLLFAIVRRTDAPPLLALGAALMLALCAPALLYSRFGFSYNLVAILQLSALGALLGSKRTAAQIAGAALLSGSALLVDVWGITTVAACAVMVCFLRPRALPAFAAVALMPPALFAAWQMISVPGPFLYDLQFTVQRLGSPPVAEQARILTTNAWALATTSWWIPIGTAGLLLLPGGLRLPVNLFFWLPIIALGRSVALFNLSFYYMVPLLPLVALGVATLGWRLWEKAQRRTAGQVVVGGMALLAIVLLTADIYGSIATGWRNEIEPFLVAAHDARRAAEIVNGGQRPGDVAIASPAITWLIRGEAADFQQVAAYRGSETPHMPADIPVERWAFALDEDSVAWIVVDDLWRNWATVHVPGAAELLQTARADWRFVAATGPVEVYCRPDACAPGR